MGSAKDSYFDVMVETSKATDVIIANYMEGLSPEVRLLPMKRHGAPRLRDLQVRTGYEINGGTNWKDILPQACAALEILNCSTYVINWFLDDKAGYTEKEQKQGLVIAGFILREVAQQILEDYEMTNIIPVLKTINYRVYLGQRMDILEMHMHKMADYEEEHVFLSAYEKRCELMSGEFYGSCWYVGSILAGKPDEDLLKMGRLFGTATQAANDFGDFALPIARLSKLEKPYQDQFSDFRGGKLTYGLYLMMKRATPAQVARLEELRKTEMTDDSYAEILQLLFDTGAYSAVMKYLKQQYKNCKKILFDAKEKSYNRDLINQILVRIVSNKFLSQLKMNMKLMNIRDRPATNGSLRVSEDHEKFYSGVSKYYDATVSQNRDYEGIASQLSQELGDAENVLDVGIGTGLVVQHLLKQNPTLRVTGVDTCQSLLDVAEANLGGKVDLHCCSISNFATDKIFDAAYSRGGAWVFVNVESGVKLASHIYDVDEVQKSFAVVAKLLSPGSKLMISTSNASVDTETMIDGGITHYRRVNVVTKKGLEFLNMDYSYFKGGEFLERKTMKARLFDEEETHLILDKAGFVQEASSGSDTFFVFRKVSEIDSGVSTS